MRILHSGLTGADEPYLVMPLYPAGSLNDELEQTGAFPLHRAICLKFASTVQLLALHTHTEQLERWRRVG